MPGRVPRNLAAIAAGACLLLGLILAPGAQATAEAAKVRIGVLANGTASWEIDTLLHNDLDARHGIDLEVVELATPAATKVALQAGRADIAVADWVWVARQRSRGGEVTFAPYSRAIGSLVAGQDDGIASVEDLTGKKLGIVGGALDKNWLLLRAHALDRGRADPAETVTTVFGAPPLMNAQLEAGRVDAVLTYWHYAARLTAKGYREVVTVSEIIEGLGIASEVPMLGYVFAESWARANPAAINGFLAAAKDAKTILRESDAAWERLRPLIQPANDAELAALRAGFRAGIPGPWQPERRAAAERLWEILRRLGGTELVGPADELAPGTFWSGEPR